MEETKVIVGRTYYPLTFADRDLTMPGVEPLVYIGHVTTEHGHGMHAFQDTVSYIRFGSRLELAEDNDEIVVYFIESSEIGSGIMSVGAVAKEVLAAAHRSQNFGDPLLPVLRNGRGSASS